MLSRLVRLARGFGLNTRSVYQAVCARSIAAAIRQQGLTETVSRLRQIKPDLSDQYSVMPPANEYPYWELKMRGLHAFQMRSMLAALDLVPERQIAVIDYGDSSGTHLEYLRHLAPPGHIKTASSLNADPVAIEKIRARGGTAELVPPVGSLPPKADFLILLETLEHFTDPIGFLRSVFASQTPNLFFTVPLTRTSRFAGVSLRRAGEHRDPLLIEDIHIFELTPEDWHLLARLAGYAPVKTWTYRQYPRRRPLGLSAPLWRTTDFEGFHAVYAVRDDSLAKRYQGWSLSPLPQEQSGEQRRRA